MDWDDAPAHGINVWMFDRSTGVIREVGYVNGGVGYQQQPYSIDIEPNGVWVYGLRTGGLLMGYCLDLVRRVPETHSTRLDGDGARLAVDAAGRFLYVAFQKVSPRIEVWAIDAKGVGVRVGAVATDEGTALEPDPGGRFLYQSTQGGIEVYATDSKSGLLTLRQRGDVGGVIELVAHPSGRFLYATRDDGTIWGYRIAPETGALEPLGQLARGRGLQFAKRAT